MSMSHGGHAGHMPASGDRKALVISGWLTGLYFIVELGIGIWTGSVAVMSDAFHTFSAVGGVLIALVAMRLGERKSSPSRTFGYIRAEILGPSSTASSSSPWLSTCCGWARCASWSPSNWPRRRC